jgi:hypothetical protein
LKITEYKERHGRAYLASANREFKPQYHWGEKKRITDKNSEFLFSHPGSVTG